MENGKKINSENDILSEALFIGLRIDLGRIIYTHKTHEKEIELLSKTVSRLRWLELLLISLTAGGTIIVLLGTGFYFQLVTTILATLAVIATIYKMSFNPEQVILEHRKAARNVWLMREKYINLLCDLYDHSIAYEEGRAKRDQLLNELHKIYGEAPDTSQKAFAIAREALKIVDEMNMTEKELDKILPPALLKIFDHKIK